MEPNEDDDLPTSRRGEPRRAEPKAELERGAARGAKPPSGSWTLASGSPGSTSRRYTPQAKRALVEEYAIASAAGETMAAFCERRKISTASLCQWRKRLRVQGETGLQPKPNARNSHGPHRGVSSYTPEQRRAAVEAFLAAGQSIKDFARIWGVSREVFSRWVKRYREGGPKAFEVKRGRPRLHPAASPSGIGQRLAQPVRDLIARIKDDAPSFGLKRIRDILFRFHAIKVSSGGVKSALIATGREPTVERPRKVRRAAPAVRRFERAAPMDLWQSDITSFLFGRHRERAYLTVFLDDCSRYVVSFALHLQQKSELVLEALKDGMARCGKPKEILTDQGRQYFSWRGKSEFQHLLQREGIKHVVARSHHPQTVGKCERLWETIKVEFLERIVLQDVADARRRLAHYFAHYNFFRPHQGIDGLVPADRFFQVQDALRQALQAQLQKNELALALDETPPPPVFLFGQIGDKQVVMHGERGRVVIQTSRGEAQEIRAEQLELRDAKGAAAAALSGVNGGEGQAAIASAAHTPPPATPAESEREKASTPGRDEPRGHDAAAGECRDSSERDELGGRSEHVLLGAEPGDRDRGAGGCIGDDDSGSGDAAAHALVAQATPVGGAEDAAAGARAVGSSESGGAAAGASSGERLAAGVAREDASDGGGGGAATLAAAPVADESAGGGRDGGRALEAAAPAPEGRTRDGLGRASGGGGSQAPEEGERGAQAQAQDRGGGDRALAGIPSAADASAREERRAAGDGEARDEVGGGERGERGGEAGHPGARQETLRDAQIDCARQLDSESGAG